MSSLGNMTLRSEESSGEWSVWSNDSTRQSGKTSEAFSKYEDHRNNSFRFEHGGILVYDVEATLEDNLGVLDV